MAETPAARLLALLEVLQARPSATGAELADAIGVSERSLRRYVQRLVDLGIPVDSERGPYGGYRLAPRFRLPPLMLTPDEAVAVTVGLVLTRRLGVTAAGPAGASALAKLQRVLPDALRDRVRAMGASLDMIPPRAQADEITPALLTELGAAAGMQRRVRICHRAPTGAETEREVDPYGVVFSSGRWYLVGHDHLRAALRTFRLDRITGVDTLAAGFAAPEGFDPVAYLVQSLVSVPYPVAVEAVLHTDLEEAQRLVSPTVGTLTPDPEGARLRIGVDSLEWAARHLVSLAVPFTVVGPEELRGALRELAEEVRAAADA
jgi:predicted DNA-binding transcriptional regulator YafY